MFDVSCTDTISFMEKHRQLFAKTCGIVVSNKLNEDLNPTVLKEYLSQVIQQLKTLKVQEIVERFDSYIYFYKMIVRAMGQKILGHTYIPEVTPHCRSKGKDDSHFDILTKINKNRLHKGF